MGEMGVNLLQIYSIPGQMADAVFSFQNSLRLRQIDTNRATDTSMI